MAKGQQNKFDDFGDKNGQRAPVYNIKEKTFLSILFAVQIVQCASKSA